MENDLRQVPLLFPGIPAKEQADSETSPGRDEQTRREVRKMFPMGNGGNMPAKVKPITEAEFLKQVLELARLLGWRTAHFRPGLTRKGRWITAVQGDGKGFPDLLLIRGDTVIVAELKVGKNTITSEQGEWLNAFQEARVAAYIWTPDNWEAIELVLSEI